MRTRLARRAAALGVNVIGHNITLPVGAAVADHDARRIWIHAFATLGFSIRDI